MKSFIKSFFILLLLIGNGIVVAQEMINWQVFVLPCSRDAQGALQLLFRGSKENLQAIQVKPMTVTQKRSSLFSEQELTEIDAEAITTLENIGFKGYEWSVRGEEGKISNAVIDETNHCIIYYPSVKYKTFKEPYAWIGKDKIGSVSPENLSSSLLSTGWSSGTTPLEKIDRETPKKFEDTTWHVFVFPCSRDATSVNCLLANKHGIQVDISGLTEKDFWPQETTKIDLEVTKKLLNIGLQKNEWILTDKNVYRDRDSRTMIYSPVARRKELVGGNFVWEKIDELISEKTGPEKFQAILKSTNWPSGKDAKEALSDIIKRGVPLLYWTTNLYTAKDKGQWKVYRLTTDSNLLSSPNMPQETGGDILLTENPSALEFVRFIYSDSVKNDKSYISETQIPAELAKLGDKYLENRLMSNFANSLAKLVKPQKA